MKRGIINAARAVLLLMQRRDDEKYTPDELEAIAVMVDAGQQVLEAYGATALQD